MKKDMLVSAIENGTVLDQIPASKSLMITRLLRLEDDPSFVAIAMRVKSKKMGTKDIIKIQGRELTSDELDALGLISPGVTYVIVKDYEVVSKRKVEIPSEVSGILKCINPTCASNFREPIVPSFKIIESNPLLLRCDFCDRVMLEENVLAQFK